MSAENGQRDVELHQSESGGIFRFSNEVYSKIDISRSLKRAPRWDKIALWIFIAGLMPLELQFFSGGFNYGNVIISIASIVSSCLVLTGRRIGGTSRLTFSHQDLAFFLIIICYIFSAIISPVPIVTITQTIYLVFIWAASILMGKIPVELAVKILIHICFITAILSFAMIIIAPSIAYQPYSSTGLPELRGIIKHQIRLGLFMAVGVGVMTITYLNGNSSSLVSNNKYLSIFKFVVIFICMISSLARSNIAFMFLALPISLGLSKSGAIRWMTLIFVIIITFTVTLNSDFIISLASDDDGRVSLSGRTLIWQRTIAAAQEAPWLGHGYASFDNFVYDYLWRDYRPPHAHNSFINSFFENGIIGVFITSIFIISQIISMIRRPISRKYSYGLFLIILGFFASLTGVIYAGKPSILFGLIILFVSMESRRYKMGRN